MNQKELNEIRRRFRYDRSAISKVYGCYVNGNGQIISYIDSSLGIMPQEEAEMYLGILKKTLSGALGKNLLNIEFSTQQVMQGEEHKLLCALRSSELKDSEAREALYQRIIENVSVEKENYVILLASDSYDVPYRGKDGSSQADASDSVFKYFICCVCPVKNSTVALQFFAEENEFHGIAAGQVITPPQMGFMFPSFDDRQANIHRALYYSRKAQEIHGEFIDAVFHTVPPMSSQEQHDAFQTALAESLEAECSMEIVQAVHEQINAKITEHAELKDPEPLEISAGEVAEILRENGIDEEKINAFKARCDEQFGENAALDPKNIIESKRFDIVMEGVKISVEPDYSYLVETRVINGRKYILIPVSNDIAVNGMGVKISEQKE